MVLEGKKIKGDWTLIRTRSDRGKNQWLLLKSDADVKPVSKKRDDESVKTGRTMKQIAHDRDAEWQSNRGDDSSAQNTLRERVRKAVAHTESGDRKKVPGARKKKNGATDSLPAAKPRFIAPMKPRLVATPPTSGDWIYELKFDGIRAQAIKDRAKVKLISRNENDLTKKFEEVAAAVAALPCDECVIDGEVVALDAEGRSSFQLLQARDMEGRAPPLCYYVFDLLQLDGKDLSGLPLTTRKEVLRQLCGGGRRADSLLGRAGSRTRRRSCARWNGADSKASSASWPIHVYEPGRRSGAWIKLKCVQRAGIRHRRLHPAGRGAQTFRRVARRLLRKKEAALCGQGRHRFRHRDARLAAQTVSSGDKKRLPFRRSPLEKRWTVGPGHHAWDDAENQLDKSGLRLPGEVRGMDTRREAAGAGFPRLARGQGAVRGETRNACLTICHL